MKFVRIQFIDNPKVQVTVPLQHFKEYCDMQGYTFYSTKCDPGIDYHINDHNGYQIATGHKEEV